MSTAAFFHGEQSGLDVKLTTHLYRQGQEWWSYTSTPASVLTPVNFYLT
jgi:hypothetical protein